MPKCKTPDEYLAALEDDRKRVALEKLRAQIRKIVPDAEEGFSYGVPAFRYRGRPLVAYAAFAKHCGFYPLSAAVIASHADELAGFALSKGTIRFHPDAPLKTALIRKLVKARLAELAD
jgi:uncharacterized protein YdhG (YjbR/CyaY superfamily)